MQLTGPNGSQQFDRLTKTKTVESILSSLDTKGIGNYIDHLFSQVDESDGKVYVIHLRLSLQVLRHLSL
jgi:DNA polymerase phi